MLTKNQQDALIAEQIIIGMLTGFLMFATLYNTWTYLIKQRKFKTGHLVLFYITTLLSLSLIMVMVFYPPLIVSPCDVLLFITVFGISYLNVILGIAQASMLTMLYVQLKHLFDVSFDLCKIEIDLSMAEREKLRQLHRREKWIRIILIMMVLFCIVGFALISTLIVRMAREEDICKDFAKLLTDPTIHKLYKIHTAIRSGLALFTSIWLITVSCMINNLINLGATDAFWSQKRQILITNVIFNLAYTCWSIYEIVICIKGFPQSFRVTTSYYLLCAFSDFLPISLVLYT